MVGWGWGGHIWGEFPQKDSGFNIMTKRKKCCWAYEIKMQNYVKFLLNSFLLFKSEYVRDEKLRRLCSSELLVGNILPYQRYLL